MEEVVQKKKGNGLAIFVLCIAFALIGAGASYYYLTVYMHKGQEQSAPKEEAKELSAKGVLVNELISRIDYSNCGINVDLYKKSKTTVSDMNEDYKRLLIVKEAIGKRVEKNITFSSEDFSNASNVLFGSIDKLNDQSITTSCPNITYDDANKLYKVDQNTPCNQTECGPLKNIRYVVKAEKTDSNIFIYVAVAAFDEIGKKVYNLNDSSSVIQSIDGSVFDIKNDYQKVNNYKYTFNYDSSNNNYIFKSIELVK